MLGIKQKGWLLPALQVATFQAEALSFLGLLD